MIIEALIIQHLNSKLDGVKAHSLVPANRESKFVVIERTGGSINNYIKSGMFVADCYAQTMEEAAELCEDVISAMSGLIEYNDVASVRLNSHYNDTDIASHEYRYGALFEVTYY